MSSARGQRRVHNQLLPHLANADQQSWADNEHLEKCALSARMARAGAFGLAVLRSVFWDDASEGFARDLCRFRSTSLARLERVDRRNLICGEFKVEHVEVLGDPGWGG